MKRLVALLVIALIGFAVYTWFYQPYAKPIVDIYRQAGQIAALDSQVENREQYAPPDDSALAPEDVERYVAVQKALAQGLSGHLDSLRAELEDLQRHVSLEEGSFDLSGLRNSAEGLLGLMIQAKEVQVDALNEQNFSLEEYSWVRREVYRAAEIPLPERGLAGVIADLRRGRLSLEGLMPEESPGASEVSEASEANRALVRSHAEALQEHAALAFLGL